MSQIFSHTFQFDFGLYKTQKEKNWIHLSLIKFEGRKKESILVSKEVKDLLKVLFLCVQQATWLIFNSDIKII